MGVPQGSVLGPVLFTEDLPKHLEVYSYPVMYADDTVLLSHNKTAETLEIDTFISVNLAEQYCIENDLVFNTSKTKYITFGRLKENVSGPPELQRVHTTKHLGLIIDDRLSWTQHIDTLCTKLGSALFALKRIKAVGTENATRTTYHALFESHMRYGITLWGSSSKDNLQRVLTHQKRAVRIMAELQPRDSCRETFKNLGILTVVALYIVEVTASAFNRGLPKNGDAHEHNTRHADNLSLPAHRTTLFTKKPSYAGARLLNFLPHNMKIGDKKPSRNDCLTC